MMVVPRTSGGTTRRPLEELLERRQARTNRAELGEDLFTQP
jgi:hypothetical protein